MTANQFGVTDLRLSEILQEGDHRAAVVHLEGKRSPDSPTISIGDARYLSEWQGKHSRIDPSTIDEVKRFQNLENIGLVNSFQGGYELSGVAQRARYDLR